MFDTFCWEGDDAAGVARQEAGCRDLDGSPSPTRRVPEADLPLSPVVDGSHWLFAEASRALGVPVIGIGLPG